MTDPSVEGLGDLEAALDSMFSPAELASVIARSNIFGDVRRHIPDARFAAPAAWFQELVNALARRGLINTAFFDLLARHRAEREGELIDIAQKLGHFAGSWLYKLRRIGRAQVTQMLYGADSTLRRKYAHRALFYRRADADRSFATFCVQRQVPCFVVTGQAGRGKSNLLCYWAENLHKFTAPIDPSRVHALLIDASALDLESSPLLRGIGRSFDPSIATFNVSQELLLARYRDLEAALSEAGERLIIFLDGINEVFGRGAYRRFFVEFTELLSARGASPIQFVLSCRSEIWLHFQSISSAGRVFRYESLEHVAPSEEPSYVVPLYPMEDIDAIIQQHMQYYHISGVISGSARQECRDPLMLHYFCLAHTNRRDDDGEADVRTVSVGVQTSLRKKAILDQFMLRAREAVLTRARMASGGRLAEPSSERELYRLTSRFLVGIAAWMREHRQTVIALEDILSVARAQGHPDAFLGENGGPTPTPETLLHRDDSLFCELLKEGTVLERADTNRHFRFVFETYLEYALGRYVALECWALGCSGPDGLNEDAVLRSLFLLIDEHRVNVRAGCFSNIFGALVFAVLIVETDALFANHPGLFTRMLSELVMVSPSSGMHGAHITLAAIRESEVGNRPLTHEEPGLARREEERIRGICEALETLSQQSEIVLLWDLQDTIIFLSQYHLDTVLTVLEAWVSTGRGLQPLFSLRALAQIGETAERVPERLFAILTRLAGSLVRSGAARPTARFWLARSIVAACVQITRSKQGRSREELMPLWQIVSSLAEAEAEAEAPFVQAVAVPALLELDLGRELSRDARMRPGSGWLTPDGDQWLWWNLIYALRDWPDWGRLQSDTGLDDVQWGLRVLALGASHRSGHVRYVAENVYNELLTRFPAQVPRLTFARHLWSPRYHRPSEDTGRFRPGSVSPHRSSGGKGRTGVVYSPEFLEPSYDQHIECRERVQAIISRIEAMCRDRIVWINPDVATIEDLELVHSADADQHSDGRPWGTYVADVRSAARFCDQGLALSRAGTPVEMRTESWHAALVSVGAVKTAVDHVLDDDFEAWSAWTPNRPPGHLANNAICMFNNVAIAARYAQRCGKLRVMIIDCDAHHGRHTDRVFRSDPSVVYLSIHQDSGHNLTEGDRSQIGHEAGAGYTINVPYPRGMGDLGYMDIVERVVCPVVQHFRPEILLCSVGFDGHCDDYIIGGRLTEHSYIHLARRLGELARACDFKIVGALEGGYSLQALARGFVHMMNSVEGWELDPEAIGLTCSEPTTRGENDADLRRLAGLLEFCDSLPLVSGRIRTPT